MNIANNSLNLDDLLPDSLIQEELKRAFWKEHAECEIELGQGIIKVPSDAILEIISKSYRRNVYNVGFGSYYAAQVAIGGVREQRSGILYPGYCFATLFYTSDKLLITIDVHSDMR